MKVGELKEMLSDVSDDSAEVVVKANTGTEMCASCIMSARHEREFKKLVQEEYTPENGCDYATIAKTLRRHALDTYVIDDSQYLMAFESFRMAGVKGYEKFTNMAVNFYSMIQLIVRELPNDKYADDTSAWSESSGQNSYQTGFDDIDDSEDDLPF